MRGGVAREASTASPGFAWERESQSRSLGTTGDSRGTERAPGFPNSEPRGSPRPAYLLLTVCLKLGWLGLCPWSKSRESRVESFW